METLGDLAKYVRQQGVGYDVEFWSHHGFKHRGPLRGFDTDGWPFLIRMDWVATQSELTSGWVIDGIHFSDNELPLMALTLVGAGVLDDGSIVFTGQISPIDYVPITLIPHSLSRLEREVVDELRPIVPWHRRLFAHLQRIIQRRRFNSPK